MILRVRYKPGLRERRVQLEAGTVRLSRVPWNTISPFSRALRSVTPAAASTAAFRLDQTRQRNAYGDVKRLEHIPTCFLTA